MTVRPDVLANAKAGASPDELAALEMLFPWPEDLHPVCCVAGLPLSPNSKLNPDDYSKAPCTVNASGQVHGFTGWATRESTEKERAKWGREPRNGICVITRRARGMDLDVSDPPTAEAISEVFREHIPGAPCRSRANSPRRLFAFVLKGEIKKRSFTLASGEIVEFLASGQQFIAHGMHKSGARYEWDSRWPVLPEISLEKFEALWADLVSRFAVKESRNDEIKPTYPERIAAEIELDPFAKHLDAQGQIVDYGQQGRLTLLCPNRAEHSTDSDGTTSTLLMLPGYAGATGSKTSVVVCLHEHCRSLSQQRFRDLAEFTEHSADDFQPLAPERSSFANLSKGESDQVVWLFLLMICIGAFLIVGRPKIGKSWFLMMFAILAGCGRDLLGFKSTGAHPGLYIAAEDTTERIVDRRDKLALGAPDNVEIWTGKQFRELAQKHSDKWTLIQFLDRYLNQRPEVRFVLIDTESTCRAIWDGERSSNDNQRITVTDYNQTREFDELALRRKVFIGLVNHSRKGSGGKNAGQSDPHELINRTNTALAGCSGSIVLADLPGVDPLDSEQRKRLLAVRGRDLDDDLMLVVEQDKATAVFTNLGKFQQVRQADAELEVLEAIRELQPDDDPDTYISVRDIAEEISKTAASVKMSLMRMRKKKQLIWNGLRLETRKGRGGGVRLVVTDEVDDLAVNGG